MDNFIDKFAQRKNAQEIIRANAMAEAKEREAMQSRLSEYELAMQEMRRCNLQNLENAEKVKELLEVSLDKINAVQKKDARDRESPDRTATEVRILLEDLRRQMSELSQRQQERTAELLRGQQEQIVELLAGQQGSMGELLEGHRARTEEFLAEQKARTEELFREQSALLAEQNGQAKELMDSGKETLEEAVKAAEDFNHKEAVKVYRNVQAVIEGALPKQTAEIEGSMKKILEKGKTSAGLMVVGVLTLLAAVGNLVIEVLRILGYL